MFRLAQFPRLLAALLLGCLPRWAAAADTDWRDIESRIQYAWYTEDARDLASVENRLLALSAGPAQRGYYLVLTQLREAQVAQSRDPALAGRAAAACVSAADEVLEERPMDAEVLALQALCMAARGRARAVDVPFAGSRSRSQMQRAQQLAPKDPRVKLMVAQLAYGEARSAHDRGQLLGSFQSATDAFEVERQGLERIPAWGAAEAWEGLAQVYLDRGDAIAARAALEHALLLMPDYRSAHRLLNHIVAG
jgi:hypothetical protein